MPSDIPEYYRHLATTPEESTSADADEKAQEKPRGMPIPQSARTPAAATPAPPAFENHYRAHSFTISLPDDWIDKTVFTLTGPVTDGIQHNITITSEADLPFENVIDFAELQIGSLEDSLKGCRLLMKEPVLMNDGREAYRAIFAWWPTEEVRIYQEQLYVLHAQTGFTLTASFTKKTRKTLGPDIEHAMRSFSPTQ